MFGARIGSVDIVNAMLYNGAKVNQTNNVRRNVKFADYIVLHQMNVGWVDCAYDVCSIRKRSDS